VRASIRLALTLALIGRTFRVQKAGRAAVLRERVRRVHAFAAGTLGAPVPVSADMVRIGYDPDRNPKSPGSFFVKATERDITGAECVVFCTDGSVWAKGIQ
jgi:hypothetical protein